MSNIRLSTLDGKHDDSLKDPAAVAALEDQLRNAQAATTKEHNLTLWQALKLYPKASAWSITLSLAVVMDGFDLILLNSLYAYPVFRTEFGKCNAKGACQVTAPWQAGLSNGASIGQIIGLIFNGWAAERFGYRRVMILGFALITIFVFIPFFAKNLPTLLVGEILCGIPWGIFQTLTTAYASEVAPVSLRPYLTTWVNACWGIGQLLSLGVLRGLLKRTDQWGWRIPFALQWIWPVPLTIVCILAPESPWWLVRKGRIEDAKRSLSRLTSRKEGDEYLVDEQIALMAETQRLEKEIQANSSYIDCFRGTNLRRTEIVCGVWAVQQLCGSAFLNITAYFLEQAGMSTTHSFDLSMGQYGINTGGVLIAWTLMASNIGRRTLYLYGCAAMCIALILIGGISLIGTTASSWAVGAMLLCWSVCYQSTVGSIAYSLVSEIPARHVLIKTMNLGRATYVIIAIIKSTFNPYMINPTAWNWQGKTGFFWAGFCLLCIVWIYFRLPEPKGLTYAEINQLFEQRVSARNFRKVGLDTFGSERERLARSSNGAGDRVSDQKVASDH